MDRVAIKPKMEGTERVIEVDLYHCKFALKGEPRGLVDDLYQVCEQAQKSVAWCYPDKQVDSFSHLLRRSACSFRNNDRSPLAMFRNKDTCTLLLVTQGHHGIDADRPPRRQIPGRHSE